MVTMMGYYWTTTIMKVILAFQYINKVNEYDECCKNNAFVTKFQNIKKKIFLLPSAKKHRIDHEWLENWGFHNRYMPRVETVWTESEEFDDEEDIFFIGTMFLDVYDSGLWLGGQYSLNHNWTWVYKEEEGILNVPTFEIGGVAITGIACAQALTKGDTHRVNVLFYDITM